jgi:DNA-binding transcriptional LysR family regulator
MRAAHPPLPLHAQIVLEVQQQRFGWHRAAVPHLEVIRAGTLRSVLAEHLAHAGQFSVVWPSNRQLSPKLRAFVDFLSERLFSDL